MSLNLRTCYHDPTNHGRQFFLLREALNKRPEDRLFSDIEIIAQNIYNLKYFQTIIYDSTERLEFAKGCARYLKYAYYPKGTQVLRKGDRGNDFYIILKGDASVFVPKNEAEIKRDTNDEKKKAFEKYSEFMAESSNVAALVETEGDLPMPKGRRDSVRSKSFSINSSDPEKPQIRIIKANPVANMILDKDNTILKDHVKGDLAYDEKLLLLNNKKFVLEPYFIKGIATFKKVTELRTGEFFGELALIFNQPRLASVIAADDLHLLMLNTSDYKEIFESQIQNVLEKMKFFEGKFDGILTGDRAKFCYLLEEKSYKFNDIIIKEGDAPDGIYIIKQGEVQLSKFSKQLGIETNKSSPANAFIRRGSIQQRRIVAATLANGNYFGDFETIKGEKMKYTAMSTTSTLVYKLKKQSYFNVVVKYLPTIVKILTEQAEIAEENRRTRLEHSEKIHFLALPSFEEKPSMSSLDKSSSEEKELHLKIKAMYKSNNEILPLHRKSTVFESIIKEVESPQETASAALKGGIKRVNSHKNFKPIISPRQTILLAPIEDAANNQKNESVVPSLNILKKLKDLPLSFSATNSPAGTPRRSYLPLTGLELGDLKSLSSTSNTPKSNRASRFKLPQLTTPKSSFSGLNVEKTNEEELHTLAERVRIRSSLVSKTLNMDSSQLQAPPSEFVNVISPNLELTKSIKSEQQNPLMKTHHDIFNSAIFVKASSEPKELIKSHTFNKQSLHTVTISKTPFKHMKSQSKGSTPKGVTKINIAAAASHSHQRTKTLESDRFDGVTQRVKTERGLAKMTLIPDGIQRHEHDFVADNQLLSIKHSNTKLKRNSHHLFRNFQSIGS